MTHEPKRDTALFIRYVAALAMAALCGTGMAADNEYPNRPIRLIVPFPAGGPSDIVGRILAQNLSEIWGKTVVVDNRPGASGIIGAEALLNANPDGYTIMLGSNSIFAVNPAVFAKLPYDVFRDFTFLGMVGYGPHLLAVRGNLPVNSIPELVAMAKKQPGKLTYASTGPGTIIQMGGELFKYHTGVDAREIPFKGGAPATVAMLSNEVDMMSNELSVFLPHLKSGRLKGLALAHPQRSPLAPDMPTFTEVGYKDIEAGTWFGLAAPAKTPPAVLKRINAALVVVFAKPDFNERLAAIGVTRPDMTAEQATAYARRETEKWTKLAKAIKMPQL
ncbi:MAG: Bug family tripartite tricarboxylate transporter substrate binding protein [Burkholderiales bacterium]